MRQTSMTASPKILEAMLVMNGMMDGVPRQERSYSG